MFKFFGLLAATAFQGEAPHELDASLWVAPSAVERFRASCFPLMAEAKLESLRIGWAWVRKPHEIGQ